MNKLEKYSSYKDSGINWVGNLPSHWKLVRIKHLFEISKKYSKDKKPNVLSLTQKGIVERDISNNEGQLAQSYVGYNIIEKDDIVFNPMDLIAGYVAKSKYNGVISHAYTTLKSLKKIDLNFYEHYFQNWYHQGVLFHLGKGVSTDNRWTLNNNSLMNLVIPIVPIDESNKIVNYISAKTAQIDEVISQKQKLIELLKEQKQIVINDAVTKGLDKDVEFVDSGVEWIGKIPKHWKLLANKYVFNLKKNLVGKKSNEYDLLSLTLEGIIKRDLDKGGKFPAEFDTYQEVKKGDFVFCLFDVEETPRTVGLSKYDGMITGAYTVFSVKNINKEYLYYFYLNLDSKKRLKPLYTGLRNTISKDNFFSFKSFIPPKNEQIKIAEYIENQTTKIDKAIELQQNYILKLKEYKASLIDSVVTGKVRVA